MRNRRNITILILAVAGMIVVASVGRQQFAGRVLADTRNIIFTDDYHLSGTHAGSIVVVANSVSADQASGSIVEGDAALIGRDDVTFSGTTTGDLTAMGGTITIEGQVSGETSIMGDHIIVNGHFSGPVMVIGESLTIGSSAAFDDQITACVDTLDDRRAGTLPVAPCQQKAQTLVALSALASIENGLGGGWTGANLLFSLSVSLLLTGLAALAVTTFPQQFSHIQEAILTSPRDLAALGFITLLLALGIAAALAVVLALIPLLGIVIIPLGLLLGVLLSGMIVVGWITLALLAGGLMSLRFTHAHQPPLVAVALGSLALFAVWHGLALLPFGSIIALLAMAALGSAGLGGAVATRLGTRSFRRQYFVQG